MDVLEIIDQFKGGDLKAERIIFDKFYQPLVYFASRFVSSREEGQKIATDVIERLFKQRENFDTLEKIEAFLYISSKNRCINFLRSRERSQKKEQAFIALQDDKFIERERLEVSVIQRIHAAVASLPDQRRRVIEMLFFEDMTFEEIAVALGISESTVRNHKRDAFKDLREKLGPSRLLLLAVAFNFGLLQYFLSQPTGIK